MRPPPNPNEANMASDKQSYDKLSRNISLTVIAVSIAPLILVGGLIFDQFASIYTERVYAHLATVVEKHRDAIDSFLNEKLSEVQYLGRVFTREQLSDSEFIEETLRGMQQQYGRIFVDLGVIDSKGRQVSYSGPFELLGANYSRADWFINSRDKKVAISDVFLGLRRSPHFIIAINHGQGEDRWTLRATIDFLAFTNLVESIRIGDTGYAYILNKAGVYQTKPPASRKQDVTLTHLRTIRQPSLPETVRVEESLGSDKEQYIIVSADLKGAEWKLIYQQSESDAFSDLIRSELIVLIIFMLGGMGIIVMALFISRKLVARFKQIDRETELMNKQVIETGKLASIGELAAGIAHEINNPVAIMMEEAGWIGDLLEDESDDMAGRGEIERALTQIRTQGVRCKDITHKLLSFARQTDSRVTKVALPPLIEEVVNLSMQQARYAQIDFKLDISRDMPPITASATELQQVFLNLINNAIQAMEHTGGELRIGCTSVDDQAFITFADTGPGIPAANLNRIFDPFFTTKAVGKGTGLGLSICFGIIHQMGGEIEVESAVGQGTTFTVRVPLKSEASEKDQTTE